MSTDSDATTQRRIGPYRPLRLLGEGGAAHTWLAEDTTTGEQLAIKELRLVKSSRTKQIELFERECAILKDVKHPQIPQFIDTIVERRSETLSLYLVQEFIEGHSLQQLLDAGTTFDPAQTVAIMKSCLEPLRYLHERRPTLYHRDIKPSNIIQRPDGSCVLVDFGAVREAIRDATTSGSSVVGTFGYMAPEQFQARAYAATDLYGLAATALHLLSGVEPGRFPLTRLKPDIHAHLDTDPHLAAILDILLEPSPEDRYSSASSLLNALERWQVAHGTPATADGPTAPVARLSKPQAAVHPGTANHITQPMAAMTAPSEALPKSTIAFVPRDETDLAALAAEDAASSVDPSGDRVTAEVAPLPSDEAEPSDAPAPEGALGSDDEPAPEAAIDPPDDDDDDDWHDDVDAQGAAPVVEPPKRTTSAVALKQRITDAQQQVDGETRRIAVVTDEAPAAEMFAPGGQGAGSVGVGFLVAGVAIAAFGLLGPLQYNEAIWIVVGLLVASYGGLLLFVPRRRPTRTPGSDGEITTPQVNELIKRVGPLGSVEWYVDYSFLARDDLHYEGRFRLPNATAAKEVASDPSRLRVRYAASDPLASVLLFRRG
jgi:hypothetical protein